MAILLNKWDSEFMKWHNRNLGSNPYKRRQVLLVILLVAVVSGGGAALYLLVEGWWWSLLNSLDFSITTISTVGFGNLTPTEPVSMLFTILYVIGGVAVFGTVLRRFIKQTNESIRSVIMSTELVTNTPRLAARLNLPTDRGVLVLGVDKQGTAYGAGLRSYDVIMCVNNRKVYTADDVTESLIKSSVKPAPVITVLRGEQSHKIELR